MPDGFGEEVSKRQKGIAPLWATEIAIQMNRNKKKWPHPWGSYCICQECKRKKLDQQNEWRRKDRQRCRGAIAGRV